MPLLLKEYRISIVSKIQKVGLVVVFGINACCFIQLCTEILIANYNSQYVGHCSVYAVNAISRIYFIF